MARDTISPNVPGLDTGLAAGRVVTAGRSRFANDMAAGATIAALIDPFGSGSTYQTVGTVPSQLALSGSSIVRGSGAVTVNGEYGLWIVVTSPDGVPQPAVKLTFRAVLPLGGTPAVAPGPSITPFPAGVVSLWDAASLSSLADGAAVTSWTDRIGGSVATQTGDSGASHTYVAKTAVGLPGVRESGAAVLATAGTNVAASAMAGAEFGIIVVACNFQGPGAGQVNPTLVASGGGTNLMLQATPTQTGRYGTMYDCGDAGLRTIGASRSASHAISLDGVNGTTFVNGDGGAGGQVTIGGWQSAGTLCCGRADILAVIVFGRAVTAADFKAVHRRYCELTGQARPGGGTARNVTFVGDSLTAGYPVGLGGSYPIQTVKGLNLPWGTWDQMGASGFTWYDIRDRIVPMIGNVSGATGNRTIAPMFEYANMRSSPGALVATAAQSVIDAVRAQETSCEIILGTSTDDGSSAGVASRQSRRDYNAALVAGLNGVKTLVRLDLDPNIGIEGAAPTNGTANTYYQSDDLHFQAAGYAVIDNGPQGFRPAISARLAAA